MSEQPTLQDALDVAIRAAFTAEQEHDPASGIVIRWALVAEVAGVDGEMYLHTIRSPEAAVWQALGMVEAHAEDLRRCLSKHTH